MWQPRLPNTTKLNCAGVVQLQQRLSLVEWLHHCSSSSIASPVCAAGICADFSLEQLTDVRGLLQTSWGLTSLTATGNMLTSLQGELFLVATIEGDASHFGVEDGEPAMTHELDAAFWPSSTSQCGMQPNVTELTAGWEWSTDKDRLFRQCLLYRESCEKVLAAIFSIGCAQLECLKQHVKGLLQVKHVRQIASVACVA